MKKQPTLQEAIGKVQRHLLKKYPHLQLQADQDGQSATIWFDPDAVDDWADVIQHASTVATDILVDSGYWIHVQPRAKQPALQ